MTWEQYGEKQTETKQGENINQGKMKNEYNRRPAIAWALALAVATAMTVAVQSSAAMLYVSQASANPSPPYATPDTAAHSVQPAVDAASDGDTVLVAPSEYDLSNQVTITKAITLRSEMGAGQTFLNVEFGDYGLWVSNSAAVLDGFTIQNPAGTSVNAGGVFLVGGTVQNCIFTNFVWTAPGPGNSVTMVGGILSNSIVDFRRIPPGFYPTAIDCSGGSLITDCQLLISGGGNGVGIHLANSQMRNSVVSGANQDSENVNPGPAVSAFGSTITDCTITGNLSQSPGGGANLDSCLMDRCVLADNTSLSAGGGGIFETNSIIRDSLIVSNRANIAQPGAAPGRGGGVYMQGGALVNCTVSEDSAADSEEGPGQGGGVYVESGGITNSIIYFNYATVGDNWTNAATGVFDHSCTTPDPGGVRNITDDPQFVDLANGNFHLATNSPCLAAGIVQAWMTNAFDLDGNPRTVNGVVDLGAYQNQSESQKQTVPQLVTIQDPQCVGTGKSNGFVFSFPTQTNRTYTVQYTHSLAPADWQTLATVAGDGTVMDYTNQEMVNPSCFYRVMAQ
jgi:hypothetical protein